MFQLNEKLKEKIETFLHGFYFNTAQAEYAGISISANANCASGCALGCTGGCYGCSGSCSGCCQGPG